MSQEKSSQEKQLEGEKNIRQAKTPSATSLIINPSVQYCVISIISPLYSPPSAK